MTTNTRRRPYQVTIAEGRNMRVTTIKAHSAKEALELALANGADYAEYGAYTMTR